MLRKIINREHDLFISVKQLVELKRVMNYPKFKFIEKQKNKFLEIIYKIAIIVDTKSKLDVIKEDMDDNILLECAVEADVDFIISGDEHLKKLKEFGKIKIVSVSEFLKIE